MKTIVLFDDSIRDHLKPFTYTRPTACIRVGITTIAEKWANLFSADVQYFAHPSIIAKFPRPQIKDTLFINGRLLPDAAVFDAILNLKPGVLLCKADKIIAFTANNIEFAEISDLLLSNPSVCKEEYGGMPKFINHIWDIFSFNKEAILSDFDAITHLRKSQPISNTVQIIDNRADKTAHFSVFLEEGDVVEYCSLNITEGSIYIGKDAQICEGAMIRGPFAMGEHAVVNMGAKISGATTLGPYCKVGGEIFNSVFFGYSNKGHDGFLGNAVIGEWCNLGADTNNSNLKNDYSDVKVWNEPAQRFVKTGLQFCGLFMGDHAKCGINTMFNTGTVVGVAANIAGAGFPRQFVPSFVIGGPGGFNLLPVKKASEMAQRMMIRRNIPFTSDDLSIFEEVFAETAQYRNGMQ